MKAEGAYDDEAARRYEKWSAFGPCRPMYYSTSLSVFGSLAARSLVDFGCGNGHFLRHCRQLAPGATLVGYDFSDAQVRAARGLTASIDYRLQSCFQPIDFKQESFDFATCHFLHPHCEDKSQLENLCRNLFASLKPEGKACLITVPWYVSSEREKQILNTAFGNQFAIRPVDVTNIPDPSLAPAAALRPDFDTFDTYTDEIYVDFESYHFRKETIEEAMKVAGFREVNMLTPVVPDEFKSKKMEAYLSMAEIDRYIHLSALKY